jgi:fatty-acid desaturase
VVFGIWRVVLLGVGLYHRAKSDKALIEQFGKGTPDDFLEFFYDRHSLAGPVLTMAANLWLFGTAGAVMWLVEMAWIPFFAAGVINASGTTGAIATSKRQTPRRTCRADTGRSSPRVRRCTTITTTSRTRHGSR